MSRSDPERFNPALRTFEVSIDAGQPDQLFALRALAAEYRLPLYETTSLPERALDELDLQEELTTVSAELFNTCDYGQSMATVIDQWRQNCSGVLEALPSGRLRWRFNRSSPFYNYNEVNSDPGRLPTSQVTLEAHAKNQLERTYPPCIVVTPPAVGGAKHSPSLAVGFGPGPVTLDTLSSFVLARKYNKCELRGSLGKAFRVLSRVAGVQIGSGSLDVQEDFIEFDELQDSLNSSFSRSSVQVVLQKINKALNVQLSTGRATKHGEVVIEGPFAALGSPTVTCERISRSSFAVIADHYTRETVHSEFLRSLAA